ncbi:receptor-like protein 56 [Corylus avellana]|uniref:receptor-like protein 56 n=1 Tax=Corylus avellana TaxID=13451 RepID=UPI00286A26C1|nr:receptor-like protein 56 [Corylus avellana]
MKISFGDYVILIWVMATTFFSFACGTGCSEEQKRALMEINNSTNGVGFLGSWDGSHCCDQTPAIVCGGIAGGVWRIELLNLNVDMESLSKWYPNVTLFTLFDELEELSITNMQIGGGLQPFCELKQLKHLNGLYLEHNGLEAVIPSCLGTIASLQELYLSRNNLYGNLPPSIFSNQSMISHFDVSGNHLEGVLSFSIFANASSLKHNDLSRNYDFQVETESPSWVPTFQLFDLILADCNLNKKNGHVVPSFISTQYSLAHLDLSRNSIEGGMPCNLLFNTNITYLSLRSNKIDASFLDCFAIQTSSLEFLDISNNHVKGRLPEYAGHLLPHLSDVNMSSNLLEGNIPWSFGNLSLETLDLSNNMFSGTIPQRLTRDGTELEYLNLSNNQLQGEMLPRNSTMRSLECLLLGGNQFEGIISPMISNSLLLQILDVKNNHLSGNIPKWLYDHPTLAIVLLGGNRFEGHLLQRMCQMASLRVFDICYNHVSGQIPSCLGNITFWGKTPPIGEYGFGNMVAIDASWRIKNMVYDFKGVPLSLMIGIDLSSNQLTGSIPSEMGDLSYLRFLNLSKNFLTGPIPNSFRNLKNVESLDLSQNKLSGKIPHELVGLTSLSTFSVAYNNLSGRIPFERQFSTFKMQCYDGNLDLCGDPLPRNCSTTNEHEPEHKGQNKDEKEWTRIIDSPLFFYAFVAVSYAFGFWVFFGILIINKNLRHTYFRAVDRFIESCFEMLSKYW